jgi:hypothetical protein
VKKTVVQMKNQLKSEIRKPFNVRQFCENTEMILPSQGFIIGLIYYII